MPGREPFEILYAPAVQEHLRRVQRQHHSSLRQAIEEHLRFEPINPTRNRKPLRGPNAIGAEWALRCGPDNRYRVLYEVHLDERSVWILAIGEKERDRLLIGNEEVQL
jgi:mRNA-degrading endonuclease RelE of RelBE toxin-antitoxin system